MRTDDFDYALPDELIAQEPAAELDRCRLLVMDRATGAVEDRIFRDIADYLRPGDLLVANETRVMPARLLGAKRGTGGAAEVFLLRECAGPEPRTNKVAFWEALVRPGKRLKPGAGAVVDFVDGDGNWTLNSPENVEAINYAIDLVNSGLTNSAPATDTRYDLQDMFGTGKVAMMIAPNSLPTYVADGGNEVNYGMAPIPNNNGTSVSAGVMDRFMCFDNEYSEEELEAIKTFFDYFFEDELYKELFVI